MAIVIPIENQPTTAVNRSYRYTIDIPVITPGNVMAARELIAFDANNNPVGDPVQNAIPPVVKSLVEWQAEPPVTVTLDAGGTVEVSAEMVLKALAAYSDGWVQSDIDAGRRTKDGRIIMAPNQLPTVPPPVTPTA